MATRLKFSKDPGGQEEQVANPYTTRTGGAWDQTYARLAPVFGEYRKPAEVGLGAIQGELSDPYRGIGDAEKALLDNNVALALGVGGGRASRLASLPSVGSVDKGITTVRGRRDATPRLRTQGPARGQRNAPLQSMPGNVQSGLGSIRAANERDYALWATLMGDERLRSYLFPYLSAYNQAVGIAGYDNQGSKGSGALDWLNTAATLLSLYGSVKGLTGGKGKKDGGPPKSGGDSGVGVQVGIGRTGIPGKRPEGEDDPWYPEGFGPGWDDPEEWGPYHWGGGGGSGGGGQPPLY